MTASKRIVHLDVFRFLMVSVALLSHVLGYFYTWEALSEPLRNYLKLFTRGATPGLLILFGFMLEFVYVKNARQRGLGFSFSRMTYRAALCYFAFVLIAAAGIVGVHTTARGFVGNLLLISPALNADIFALYFFTFFAMMPIIILRLHLGVTSLLGVIAGIWALDVLVLQHLHNPFSGALDNLAYLSLFLIGLGDSWGPSVLHGLTVVAFGMILANAFVTRSRASLVCLATLISAAASILTVELTSVGWSGFLNNVADYGGYRAHNSVVYFAYGVIHALLVMGLAFGVNRVMPQVLRTPVTYLGSRTFLYFLFGNLIITLIPQGHVNTSLWTSLAEFALLVIVCYALISLWEARLNGWLPVVRLREALLNASTAVIGFLRRFTTPTVGPPSPDES